MKIKNNMFSTNTSKSPITNTDFLNFAYSKKIYFTVLIILFYSVTIHPSSTNDHRINNLYDSFNNNHLMNNQNDLLLSNPSEWLICGTSSWQDLKNYLPEAKMSGVSVTVMLLPPFQSAQVCTDGNYSEPFGQDYILWAEEIALLSLRYSNLISYGIYDLQENLNLGYLRPSYIDSMIAAGTSINPRLQFININTPSYQVWYVDRDATGNGNGTSWTNAANTVSSLPWTSINAGDTVYISGGTESKTYPKENISAKVFTGGQVVITKGKDVGHSGGVIFQQSGVPTSPKSSFKLGSCEGIKLTGLTFSTTVDTSYQADPILLLSGGQNNIVDNCHIIDNGTGGGIGISSETKATINNCIIETLENNAHWLNQDNITIVSSEGGLTITGNTIIARGIHSSPHIDLIQFVTGYGSVNNYETVIANNFFYYNSESAKGGSNVIYIAGVYSNRFLIYNNIIAVNATNGMVGICAYPYDVNYNLSMRIFNNTIITGSPSDAPFVLGDLDTLIMKNNIVLNDSASATVLQFIRHPYTDITFKDIDYNHYNSNGGTARIRDITGAGYITWAAWQALGYDGNSDTGAVSFAEIWGTHKYDYLLNIGSAGVDEGTNLSTFFGVDIIGTIRSQGAAWDKGALER